MWKSKLYGAFVLNRRVDLHAIDAAPARWRGGAGSSPLDAASAATSSPRNDLLHPTHWLIYTQVLAVESDGEGRYLFALEYLSKPNFVQEACLSETQDYRCLKWLARFHALGYRLKHAGFDGLGLWAMGVHTSLPVWKSSFGRPIALL